MNIVPSVFPSDNARLESDRCTSPPLDALVIKTYLTDFDMYQLKIELSL